MRKLFTALMAVLLILSINMTASAKTATADLAPKEALSIAKKARTHYWSTMIGHNLNNKNTTCKVETFIYKGTDYRYFCTEFNTKKKLVSYLNEVFTLNAIEKGVKKYRFIEYKGKLAQPNADGGSLLDWEKAKGKLIYSKKDVRLYEFSVPLGETGERSKEKVTFVKVKNQWLINAIDAVK
ncbi:hypothetical protein BLX88_03120 [Bacillus obstructivus]|nr:hypothetical protein BLX88_03120 [Bacillus obstructivus]